MIDTAVFVALFALLGLAIFQVALICGAPLGHYAWGGAHKILPRQFRIASIVSILIYFYLAIILTEKAGMTSLIDNDAFVNTTMWVITGYFVVGIFMNGISRSKKERAVMTPVALLLAAMYLIVAMG